MDTNIFVIPNQEVFRLQKSKKKFKHEGES